MVIYCEDINLNEIKKYWTLKNNFDLSDQRKNSKFKVFRTIILGIFKINSVLQ